MQRHASCITVPQQSTFLNEDILLAPVTPVPVNSRGNLGFEKSDFKKAMRLMVVFFLLTNLLLSQNQYYFNVYNLPTRWST